MYDAGALATLELAAGLRRLGLGLDTVRAVLEERTMVPEVPALHARALDAEIRTLKLRRAALNAENLLSAGGGDLDRIVTGDAAKRAKAAEQPAVSGLTIW